MGRRANGEGTVWHHKARGRWEGRITIGTHPDGRPIRKTVIGKTRNECLARIREALAADQAGEQPARADLTVRTFLNRWLDDILPGTVAASTEIQYRDVIRLYVIPNLGQKRLRTLNAGDVARMLRTLAAEGKAPNTCRLARSVLRRALRWAEAEGMVTRNVAAIADGVRVPAPEGRTMTPEQARQFLDCIAGDQLEAAWIVALTLGLRRGEVLGLAWSDLSLDDDPPTLSVRRSLTRLPKLGLRLDDTKTRQSRRTLALPAVTVEALRTHRQRQREARLMAGAEWVVSPLGADLVFRTAFGRAVDPDGFRQATYRATEQALGERWSPHELRHSAASLLIAAGVPLKQVSESLGHTTIRVTADVYAHLLDEARVEVAAGMERALGR